MKEYISNSVENTFNIAKDFAKTLKPNDVIAFVGGLGAGKTAFVRGLGAGLNVSGEICSPTFAIVNEYRGKIPLIHFDMYRIETMDDLYTCGYFDYLDSGVIMAIEWSENIWSALPENTIYIEISTVDENIRNIKISQRGQVI